MVNLKSLYWYRSKGCRSLWPGLILLPLLSLFLVLYSCEENKSETYPEGLNRQAIIDRKIAAMERYARKPVREQYSGLAAEMVQLGLVDVRAMDPSIQVSLAYAGTDNFLDSAVYGTLDAAFLRIEAAAMLSIAQDELKRRKPGYHLLVYDAARPRRIQEQMWALVKGTPQRGYVADPVVGSLHNYGAAVDLSIADSSGVPLDMGTAFDHFGPLAQPRHEARFLQSGELSREQIANRRLLREVMQSAGFQGIPNEWWHFNAFGINYVRSHYPVIE